MLPIVKDRIGIITSMEIKGYEIESLISQTNYRLGEIGFTADLKTTEWAILPLRNDFHNILQDSFIIIDT